MPEFLKPHLLIVEEDPAVAHVIRALLKHGGMTCDVVSWPPPVLKQAAVGYAAILMDADLSYDEGYRRIQELRFHGSIPLIVIAGRSEEHEKVRAFDAGADDFIVKPFFPGELLARIRALLRRQEIVATKTG